MMGAGFQRDIGGAALCRLSGLPQGDGFAVRSPAPSRMAATDNMACFADNHAPNRGIGPG